MGGEGGVGRGVRGGVSSPMFCYCLGPALKMVPCIDWVVHWDLVLVD